MLLFNSSFKFEYFKNSEIQYSNNFWKEILQISQTSKKFHEPFHHRSSLRSIYL